MIITCKKRISFLWIVLATLPWVAVILKDKTMGIAFTYSMRKFVDNPAALTFILSIPLFLSWFVPPLVNYFADRIWTRIGRRKPFIVTSWIGTIASIFCMPLAPDFATLLIAYTAFIVFNDLGGPVESLKMEIVPPAQRSGAAAVLAWLGNIASLTFWVVAIGRFDEMTDLFGMSLFGEQGLYWMASGAMVIMLLFLTLGIKETNPHSASLHQGFSLRKIINPQLWPVFILVFSTAILGTGLGVFANLLTTEQWGYTKQDIGTNIAVGGIINIFLIPALGIFASRMGRSKVYVALVLAGIAVNLAMYLYYNYVLYDARPTLVEMILFGEMLSIIGVLTSMALTPLMYDFIPRNELGTFAAGSGLVGKVTGIVTVNLMGLFVTGYSYFFLAPGGEMARVALREDSASSQVLETLKKSSWNEPGSGAPINSPHVTVEPWYATGARLDHGRGFEIRIKDEKSVEIRELREQLESDRGKHLARETYARSRLVKLGESPSAPGSASTGGSATTTDAKPLPAKKNQPEIEQRQAEAAAEAAKAAALQTAIASLDQELERRANSFKGQVETALAGKLIVDGEHILGAKALPGLIVGYPLTKRPEVSEIERVLDLLRSSIPELVDLRLIHRGESYRMEASLAVDPSQDGSVTGRLTTAITTVAGPTLKNAFPQTFAADMPIASTVLRLDLRILEDPLDRHPSPVTRVVNRVLAWFDAAPAPERRLRAVGRSLRRPDWIEHVGVALVPGDDHAIRISAMVGTKPEDQKADPPTAIVVAKFAALGENAIKMGALHELAVVAAREQRMTVARPVLTAAFAKQQYDYLAGYVAVLVLQVVGLGIALSFLGMVRRGTVRRRGVEEAEASP